MVPTKEAPVSFGVIIFPQVEVLDVQGPLEALNMLARKGHDAISLSIISRTLAPVSVGPIGPDTLSAACAGRQFIVPTHTFADCPPLDVLLVPGGLGALTPTPSGVPAEVDDAVEFIRQVFPGLKQLITVCTGAGIAARAGVLDGLRATANKRRFKQVAGLGPKTHWVARARWVIDGKVWSTAGVSAGIDGVVAWIAETWGDKAADDVCQGMEYERRRDPGADAFAAVNGVVDIPPVE